MDFSRTALLIPAYNPDERLCGLLRELAEYGFAALVVVDDGSRAAAKPVFDFIGREIPSAVLLTHEKNAGKGAALKLGFDYLVSHHSGCSGVVTLDADGQHCVEDVLGVSREHLAHPEDLILGMRDFNRKGVPFRCRLGNRVSRALMRLFFGIALDDTQSGLRALPLSLLPFLQTLNADRYEFELEMLVFAKRREVPIRETAIRTLYPDGGRSSHFRAVRDSLRILLVMFRLLLIPPRGGATDWNRYYSAPPATAGFARRIVSARLMHIIGMFRRDGRFTVTELGGGDSCFYDRIAREFQPLRYTVCDNNVLALRRFRDRVGNDSGVVLCEVNLLRALPENAEKADLVFSVGLIEHFSPLNTARMVRRHFELAKTGGLVILFFPTPTPLYRATRFCAELLRLWMFHDERPLRSAEVERVIAPYGHVVHRELIRANFLTQRIIVARKEKI